MTNAKPPSDSVYVFMLAIYNEEVIRVEGGDLVLHIEHMGRGIRQPVDPVWLDEVEDRGWVEHTDTGLTLSEKGEYWLEKWVKQKGLHKGRKVTVLR